MYEFVIRHKVHPYTRTTQAMKWVDPRYAVYKQSQVMLRHYLSNAMVDNDWPMLGRQPMQAAIVIHLKTVDHRVDLDNQVKAVLDAAQGIVFPFDGWVDAIYARRRKSTEDRLILYLSHDPLPGVLARITDELDRLDLALGDPD